MIRMHRRFHETSPTGNNSHDMGRTRPVIRSSCVCACNSNHIIIISRTYYSCYVVTFRWEMENIMIAHVLSLYKNKNSVHFTH